MNKEKMELTMGLEIHAELKTNTKMFCDCKNDSDEKEPNVNICPVCSGQPGAMPTINKKAVLSVMRVGCALGCKIIPKGRSKFDRKNYFYPDLPKGYQISQYEEPICEDGILCGVRIKRIHLEEDAGRLAHIGDDTLVDLNRAGVPLMELVTEPDIRSASQAGEFAKELRRILRYLGVSMANMEKGEMRLEANVSINMGTKVEVKNINSFKSLEEAIIFEYERQKEVIEKGEKVTHETRGWDDVKRITVSQRSKEEAQDYRYFPEPDLPAFNMDAFNMDSIKASIPELPLAKKERFIKEYFLDDKNADILVDDFYLADFYEKICSELNTEKEYKMALSYLTTDVFGYLKENSKNLLDVKLTSQNIAHLVQLLSEDKINSRIAKDILPKIIETGMDPHFIVEQEGLLQVSDDSLLTEVVKGIIERESVVVLRYKNGEVNLVQYLIGIAMKEMKGKGDPKKLKSIFEINLK